MKETRWSQTSCETLKQAKDLFFHVNNEKSLFGNIFALQTLSE